jgi:hypothetical protein
MTIVKKKHVDREQISGVVSESFNPQFEKVPEFCPTS